MFDDSVILNVKIEDDTEKHKTHDKYKVSYISFKLEEFINLNKNIEEFNFNNLEEVKLF